MPFIDICETLTKRLILFALLVSATLAGRDVVQTRSSAAAGQSAAEGSAPLSVDAAMKTFHLPVGYHVELVASEPMIQDPVVIDWDADGRLWAVEMPRYMTDIQASRELDPVGRVVVLEDVDDDGKMDKRTLFAGFVTRS